MYTSTTTATTTMSKIKDNPIPEQVDSSISLTPTSQASSLFIPNGINSHPKFLEFSDIEMISLHSLTYTSLKDIISPSNRSPPPGIMSPTNNSSWHEIPIKNPLVKQAALAYLQPMSFPPESDDRGFFTKLMDKCCCGGGGGGGGGSGCDGDGGRTGRFGCLAYFAEVVVRSLKHAFRENVDYDYEDYDSDDDEDDKVD